MRVYCRPSAMPLERLESHMAFRLCSRPGFCLELADLLARVAGVTPARAAVLAEALTPSPMEDPAEAMGVARAALLLCGLAPERGVPVERDPRAALARLLEGGYPAADPLSPATYEAPSLLEAYCHMGAGFAQGVDRVFLAATGRTLAEHLRRAPAVGEPMGRTA